MINSTLPSESSDRELCRINVYPIALKAEFPRAQPFALVSRVSIRSVREVLCGRMLCNALRSHIYYNTHSCASLFKLLFGAEELFLVGGRTSFRASSRKQYSVRLILIAASVTEVSSFSLQMGSFAIGTAAATAASVIFMALLASGDAALGKYFLKLLVAFAIKFRWELALNRAL